MSISVTETTAQPAVAIARKALADSPDMESIVFAALQEVGDHLATRGVQPAGAPFRRITAMEDDTIEFEVGFPVAGPVVVSGEFKGIELPAEQVATITHQGAYDSLPDAYVALCTWVEEQNLQIAGGSWEAYVTSQIDTADNASWRTQIFLPVA